MNEMTLLSSGALLLTRAAGGDRAALEPTPACRPLEHGCENGEASHLHALRLRGRLVRQLKRFARSALRRLQLAMPALNLEKRLTAAVGLPSENPVDSRLRAANALADCLFGKPGERLDLRELLGRSQGSHGPKFYT